MTIYYKCSFPSSNGYRMVRFDVEREMTTVVENSDLPEAISFLLNSELNHNTILASDENGMPFLGIFGMEDDNSEKYVNAVFYAPDNPQRILNIYYLFLHSYCDSIQAILRSVERLSKADSTSGLEYRISTPSVLNDNEVADSEFTLCAKKTNPHNSIIAFISEDSVSDYELQLQRFFSFQNTYAFNHISINARNIDGSDDSLVGLIKRKPRINMHHIIYGIIIFGIVLFVAVIAFYIYPTSTKNNEEISPSTNSSILSVSETD